MQRLVRRSLQNQPFRRAISQNSQTSQAAKATAKPTPSVSSPRDVKQASRIERLISRSPKFLHKHLHSLRAAPVSHITAFLIIHELTAVVPLFGLAGAFHYYQWLPPYFAEGAWVIAGVEKFGRYARRKGWISVDEELEAEREVRAGDVSEAKGDQVQITGKQSGFSKWMGRGEGSVRWIVEFATAYAVVKAFLIPRLLISAWTAPWFARLTVIPIFNAFKSARTRVKKSTA